ncbi:MAG: polyprenyl diphosphate synthase [Nitriliruptoraceae bacterium]
MTPEVFPAPTSVKARAFARQHDIDTDRVPGHVAVIMDGNGRWANARGLPRQAGHEAGEPALFEVVEAAIALNVKHLTVYAFSTENWQRPSREVAFLLTFNRQLLQRRGAELNDRNVQVRFIGRRDERIPDALQNMMHDTETLTKQNTGLVFRVAFNYGGQAEIVDAAQTLAQEVRAGTRDTIDEAAIQAHLYDPTMPAVDLLIRSSGEQRISNFLLWQTAYAELLFTDTAWPDFTRDTFAHAIGEYQGRTRRFGSLSS